ncbi:Oidioi.mRNA.OKI2018_I69.chr2.g6063.t1.cds [Oikopleura dioica]|uniref:Oidioi.mRNA.OKI2018_I69.chr2.g6063.t1.cds n=1 Tax=Oikopleura dioica TaxID=34765 RepID=A0ABN7T6N6_OIKDI|nr:Oidioi.mRNA.OKI2018_I69.chr2.g6063.t1.cds [Oikopleura dioica]
MPLEKLGPDQERVLKFGDVVGFRQDALIFRIESGSTRKTSKSDEINEENTEAISEEIQNKEESQIGSDNAEWTSGSISNHEDENKSSKSEAGPSHINTAAPARTRPPCEYGGQCYRRNPNHKIEFCHPGDDDWWDPLVENDDPDFQDPRPECQYGILCYQKSEAHRRKFQHNTAGSAPKRRAARKAEEKNKEISSDSDDLLRESESEVEYDISSGEEERPAKMQKITAEAKELINETKKMLRDRNF